MSGRLHSVWFFRDLKLLCTPCQHDIMSTITAYKWPSLKYRMYCCSISGPSVMSMSLKHCRDRPHDLVRSSQQNNINNKAATMTSHFVLVSTKSFGKMSSFRFRLIPAALNYIFSWTRLNITTMSTVDVAIPLALSPVMLLYCNVDWFKFKDG